MANKPNIPEKNTGDQFTAEEVNTIVDFFETKPDGPEDFDDGSIEEAKLSNDVQTKLNQEPTTDASDLTSGTLPAERIGNESIEEGKLSTDLQTKISQYDVKFDFLLNGYTQVMRFNGTANGSITEIELNDDGDYIEFYSKIGPNFTGFTDGLGLAGSGSTGVNNLGYYDENTIYLRQNSGGSYIIFSDLDSLAILRKIKVAVNGSDWELFIDDVSVDTQPKTSSFVIDSIGNGYDGINKVKADLSYCSIYKSQSDELTTYRYITDFESSENITYEFLSNDTENIDHKNVFISYDPTGHDGNELVMVYVKRKGNDSYIGFEVAHEIDEQPIVYLDYWRIIKADEYEYDGESMSMISENTIYAGESEFTMLCTGKADHTGGFHGDEQVTSIYFYINGVSVELTDSFNLLPAESFSYLEYSTLHETANSGTPTTPITGHPEIATHVKYTTFSDYGYKVRNQLTFTQSFSVERAYGGISCLGSKQSSEGFNDRWERADFTGSNANKLLAVNRREIYANNPTEELSVFATSKMIRPESMDSTSIMLMWDRPLGAKYYRYTATTTPSVSELWQMEMNVTFS